MLPRCLSIVAGLTLLTAAPAAEAQTPISRYNFNGDLLNASTFKDANMVDAPDGTFRQGADSATAPAGTATFGRGVDGVIGGALLLDGVDDWVDVTTAGHPSSTVPAGSFSGPGLLTGTVMAWVRTEPSTLDGASWLMGSTNAQPSFQSWQMGYTGDELMARPAAAGNDSQRFVILDATKNTAWADGQWHFLAVSWDGVIEEAEVYVDGMPLGIAPTDPNLTFGVPQQPWQFPMAIGGWNNHGTLEGFWQGLVDDLRVYAEPLSDAQVLSIFNATTIVPDPNATGADFDADLDSDGADFLIWQRGVGVGNTFAQGDANDDNVVNGTDLGIWKESFVLSATPAVAAAAAVPEPASAALATLAAIGLAMAGRCRSSRVQ